MRLLCSLTVFILGVSTGLGALASPFIGAPCLAETCPDSLARRDITSHTDCGQAEYCPDYFVDRKVSPSPTVKRDADVRSLTNGQRLSRGLPLKPPHRRHTGMQPISYPSFTGVTHLQDSGSSSIIPISVTSSPSPPS